jgi:hypothetical protein
MFYGLLNSLAALCLPGTVLSVLAIPPQKTTSLLHTNPPIITATQSNTLLPGLETIENGVIKVGVDGRYGGAITYLSPVGGINMVNNFDLGRQFQLSLYGGPLNFSQKGHPMWVGLGWNPIQAGDVNNNPGQVIAFSKQANQLYVKTIPTQFALNNVPGEATIEHWISLTGNVVKVHAKVVMNRTDKTQYEARTQEWPCLFVNGPYHNIYTYQGNNPYGNGTLTKLSPPMEMEYLRPITEPWMAATDNKGFGVGVFVPNNYTWTKAFFGENLKGDEFDGTAGYIANTEFAILDHNLVHEWDYQLVVGNIDDIRAYVYTQPRLAPTINYRFTNSRLGWHYARGTDTGWPIQNQLHVFMSDRREGQLKSPAGFWRGRDNKTLYIRAAFQGQSDKYRLHWRQLADKELYSFPDRYVDFPIINDGQFHTYTVDLSQKTGWVDQDIIQIALRPRWDGPEVNGWVKLESITTTTEENLVVTTPPTTTTVTPTPPVTTTPPVTPPVITDPPVTSTPPITTTPPTTTVVSPTTPTPTTDLQLIAPTYNCNTGALTFKTTGGNGSAVEFMAVGVTVWTTNPNQTVDAGVRSDLSSKPLMLMARQNSQTVSYSFDFRAACPSQTEPSVPTPPTTGGIGVIIKDPGKPEVSSRCLCPVITVKRLR